MAAGHDAPSKSSAPSPDPRVPSRRSERGTVGELVLCELGASLVLLQSYVWILYGSVSQTLDLEGFSTPYLVAGSIGLLEGALLGGFGLLSYTSPRLRASCGVGMITIGLLSLLIGGGFLIGAVFAYFAGVAAVLLPARSMPYPAARRVAFGVPDDPVIEADLLDSGVEIVGSPDVADPSQR